MNETEIKCVSCGAINADPRPWDAREPQCPDCQDRSTPVGVHVPEAFAGAPERHPLAGHAALAGPYHADETGTFNNAGWGFSVIVPSEFWGGDPDDFPENIRDAAETLERAIRLHLNAAAPPAPQVEGAK